MLMSLWMLYSKWEGGVMTGNNLNASDFLFNDSVYTKEFEDILSKITTCFIFLKEAKKKVPLNDENGIRDILVNDYINNPKIKRSIGFEYFVLPEVVEVNSTGRTDIRIFSPNSYFNQEEYFVIECKRLNSRACRGSSGLNYKYIDNGIRRFIQGTYSSFYKINAMIGFIVEAVDINKQVNDLNYLLTNFFPEIKTISLISEEKFISDFDSHYSSKHITNDGGNLKLYHMMYDFST